MANANVQTAANDQELSSVQFLTVTAIFVALTYIFTAFINVRLPIAANGGLIHLGNVPLFIGAIIFGKKTGAIAGGVGMGLFDLRMDFMGSIYFCNRWTDGLHSRKTY